MQKLRKKLVLCRREDWLGSSLHNIELVGDSLRLDGGSYTHGFACLPAVDSGEDGFGWGRVSIGLELPGDCMLRVRAFCADEKTLSDGMTFEEHTAELVREPRPLEAAERLFGSPAANSGDFLLHGTGRYLWLMIELGSANGLSPSVSSVSIYMAGDHMTDYLPGIYRTDDFTYRFLSIFDSLMADMEDSIDALPGLLDYEQAPEDMLRYLSEWLCLPEDCPEGRLLERIKYAVRDYETMYTLEGVRRSIRRLTGQDAMILEYSDIDPNNPLCQDPELFRKLYGNDPYKFFVLMEQDAFPKRRDMEIFIEKMRDRIPAGVEMELILLKDRTQLGWHTYMGKNTVITGTEPMVIDENTTIHYESIIGGEKCE